MNTQEAQERQDEEAMLRQFSIPVMDTLTISRDDLRRYFSHREVMSLTDDDMVHICERVAVAIEQSLEDEMECCANRLIREKATQ